MKTIVLRAKAIAEGGPKNIIQKISMIRARLLIHKSNDVYCQLLGTIFLKLAGKDVLM